MKERIKVLHVTGSPESQFFADLSLLYARGCLESACDSERYESLIAYVGPDNQWRFPKSLSADVIADAEPMSFAHAMQRLEGYEVEVIIPQMFCQAGMTHYRSLSDLLDVPMVGNSASVMAVAADKVLTRSVVSDAGVQVPKAKVLRLSQLREHGDFDDALDSQVAALSEKLPLIVKPALSDNSVGVSRPTTAPELRSAMEEAFEHSETVLVEDYIPLGREVRCGVVDRQGELMCLPLQEYRMEGDSAYIRETSSKLTQTEDGNLDLTSKYNPQSWIVDEDDPLTQRVWDAAKNCHRSLGCRDYSLFDFRIDSQGRPWFLEAGLYCSFSPSSILVAMVEAAGIPLSALFNDLVDQAMHTKHGLAEPKDPLVVAGSFAELAGHGVPDAG